MYPNLVVINPISLLRLAQRGDRAFVKIRGGTRLTRTLTRPTQSGPALAVGRNNALPHQRSCRVRGSSLPLPRFSFAASRFSDLSLLPHSRCSRDDSLHRSRRVLAPTLRPKAVFGFPFPLRVPVPTGSLTRRRSRSSSIAAAGTRTGTSTTSTPAPRSRSTAPRASASPARTTAPRSRKRTPGGCNRRGGADRERSCRRDLWFEPEP